MAKHLKGVGVSPGLASGVAFVYRPPRPARDEAAGADPAGEWARVERALAAVEDELRVVEAQAASRADAGDGSTVEAQRAFLHDTDLLDAIRGLITVDGLSADSAVARASEAFAGMLEASESAYLAERAVDLRDVAARVARALAPGDAATLPVRPCILVASDLPPSEVARLGRDVVQGLCLAGGGVTSHTAIAARHLGIPAVVALGDGVAEVRDGDVLLMDGTSGAVIVAPDEATLRAAEDRQREAAARDEEARRAAAGPAVTRDGRRVEVHANAGGLGDVDAALALGADGIGLLRTESLFRKRRTAPDEETLFGAYSEVARRMGARPVVVRALDAGADKPLPYFRLPPEDNPFLGERGVRLLLAHPELFEPQLRAVLRAAREFPTLRLMIPMIADARELHQIRALIEIACFRAGWDESPLALGLMVETPAAALTASQLAPWVDFFSIGSNDLTQYTVAADRGNPRVSRLYSAWHPAVLHLIKLTVEAAHAAGKPVGLCGELASDPRATALLVGLGLDALSMAPRAIPGVKAAVRATSVAEAEAIAARALAAPDADHVAHVLKA